MKCIYCLKENDEGFSSVEHVIPQSFGKFSSDTPTLDCVCDECNAYFSKELDQVLARDTLEGISRYKKGLFSRERRFPKSVRFTLAEGDEAGEYAGALMTSYDPLTGEPPKLRSQFWIKNIQNKDWERYPIEEIKSIELTEEKYGSATPGSREMRVIAPFQEKYNAVLAELKRCNIPYREREMLDLPPFVKNVNEEGKIIVQGNITGTVGKVHKRALAKTLFNFATKYLGAEETSKPEWDKARNFIRNDGEALLARMSQKEFWTGQEQKNMRFPDDSYNLRIENQEVGVVGVIQIYNLFTYEFVLAEKYRLPTEKEIAYRFTPGQKPFLGVKMDRP
ncbi:HNH endonuclease [Candidatus Parcubacteria bacterium]|nr:MAG: HNH endonuclease [Candidatus Parcubacteria bacterium]